MFQLANSEKSSRSILSPIWWLTSRVCHERVIKQYLMHSLFTPYLNDIGVHLHWVCSLFCFPSGTICYITGSPFSQTVQSRRKCTKTPRWSRTARWWTLWFEFFRLCRSSTSPWRRRSLKVSGFKPNQLPTGCTNSVNLLYAGTDSKQMTYFGLC